LKSAIVNDLGFGLIPYYVVKDEIDKKVMHDYKIDLKSPMSFGVWWQKDFANNELKDLLIAFLKTIDLG
jgi:DNA-binding transcriptional LysR family regulator